MEGWDSFCLGDEYDNDETEQEDVEPLDDKEKTAWRAVKVWEHYRSRMITEIARIAYLCSPHPVIIAHSQDSTNKDPENLPAIERFIDRIILPWSTPKPEDRVTELARLVEKYWEEREDFVKCQNYFNRNSIWIIASREDTNAYKLHKRYSYPCTEMFGHVACISTSEVMGCGQAECIWKAMKAQKTGKQSNLGLEKTKKQAVISAAFARQKNTTK